jgi:hypothetical protein
MSRSAQGAQTAMIRSAARAIMKSACAVLATIGSAASAAEVGPGPARPAAQCAIHLIQSQRRPRYARHRERAGGFEGQGLGEDRAISPFPSSLGRVPPATPGNLRPDVPILDVHTDTVVRLEDGNVLTYFLSNCRRYTLCVSTVCTIFPATARRPLQDHS